MKIEDRTLEICGFQIFILQCSINPVFSVAEFLFVRGLSSL